MVKTEVIIVGAGPAGLSQALILADAGIRVVMIDRAPVDAVRGDNRTAALLRPAVDILQEVSVDPEIFPATAPLKYLRLIDGADQGSEFQADFSATEINEPYFALNILNTDLHTALAARVMAHDHITVIAPCRVTSMDVTDYMVTIETDRGEVSGMMVVGADGRQSVVRQLAGISIENVDYNQTAITCTITHTRAHDNRSTEFHRPGGPLTLVPLSGNRSSIVWMERTGDAAEILNLSPDDFKSRLQDGTHGAVGDIMDATTAQSWPLIWQRAGRIIGPRVALVAEAAHALPPSGAQGLNMSLQDVAALGSVIVRAHQWGMDLGSGATLASYARLRLRDMHIKTNAVDGLNRMIMTAHPALRRARRAGLIAASTVPFVRRAVMRFGWMGK